MCPKHSGRMKLDGAQSIHDREPSRREAGQGEETGRVSDNQPSGLEPQIQILMLNEQNPGRKRRGFIHGEERQFYSVKEGWSARPQSYKLDTNHHLPRGALHPGKLTHTPPPVSAPSSKCLDDHLANSRALLKGRGGTNLLFNRSPLDTKQTRLSNLSATAAKCKGDRRREW